VKTLKMRTFLTTSVYQNGLRRPYPTFSASNIEVQAVWICSKIYVEIVRWSDRRSAVLYKLVRIRVLNRASQFGAKAFYDYFSEKIDAKLLIFVQAISLVLTAQKDLMCTFTGNQNWAFYTYLSFYTKKKEINVFTNLYFYIFSITLCNSL